MAMLQLPKTPDHLSPAQGLAASQTMDLGHELVRQQKYFKQPVKQWNTARRATFGWQKNYPQKRRQQRDKEDEREHNETKHTTKAS